MDGLEAYWCLAGGEEEYTRPIVFLEQQVDGWRLDSRALDRPRSRRARRQVGGISFVVSVMQGRGGLCCRGCMGADVERGDVRETSSWTFPHLDWIANLAAWVGLTHRLEEFYCQDLISEYQRPLLHCSRGADRC